MYFCYGAKPANSKFATKTVKKKTVNGVILHSDTTRRRKKISKMDEEDEHSPSEFYYPEVLETFDVETETGITKSQDAI